jgi:pimeloyl-ACP methyl ester carboxylesterase
LPINCYFTGRAGRKLFTVYEPPADVTRGERAVVLCYPPGADYFNSHRAFVKLSTILATSGAHVLRFDWYGTGDSAGDGTEVDLSGWRQDLITAIEELKFTSGLARVWLVGLRFGAALALMGAKDRTDVAGVVLWDPILDGTLQVRESLHRPLEVGGRRTALSDVADQVDRTSVADSIMTTRLQEELEAIDAKALLSGRLPKVFMLVSDDLDIYGEFRAQLREAQIDHQHEVVPSAQAWQEARDQWAGEIPLELLQRLNDYVR